MKKLIVVASTVLFAISSVAFATSMQSLNKSQVTKSIEDKTITTIPLVTVNGQLTNNTFTGYFNKNGQLNGQLTNKPDDGPQADQGKWMVKADGALCATWDNWNKGKSICVAVYKLQNGMLFVNTENKKIETMVLDSNIQAGNKIS